MPSRDVAAREAFDGLGATWDFFREVLDRDSIDDEGMRLDATVHYAERYNNAFWNGSQMVFGDGDGEIFNRFTASVDVIGHELAHGVTEDEAGLVPVPAWRAQRVHLGRLRVACQTEDAAPDCARGRLAGWRGIVHDGGQCAGAPIAEGARHRVRRPGPRPRPSRRT